MFSPKIKIDRNLYESLKKAAQVAGYSSVDEFILHILEKTAAEVDQAQSEEEVRKRLQGLGYIEE
jgi:predicted CopG family antitoxin